MGNGTYSFVVSFPDPRATVVRAQDARSDPTEYWSDRALSIEVSGSLDDFYEPWSQNFDEVDVKFDFYDVPSGREVGSVDAVKFSDDETGKRFNQLSIDLILPPHMFAAVSQCLLSIKRGEHRVVIYTDENPAPWAEQEDPLLLNVEKFEFIGETFESIQDEAEDKIVASVDDDSPPLWWQRRHQETKKTIERIFWLVLIVFAVSALISWVLD